MVSVASDSFSSDIAQKRPLENAFALKYKPRKVNARRDFPPGCGSNAAVKYVKPDKSGCVGDDRNLQASGLRNGKTMADDQVLGNSEEKTMGTECDGVKTVGIVSDVILSQKKTSELQDGVESSEAPSENAKTTMLDGSLTDDVSVDKEVILHSSSNRLRMFKEKYSRRKVSAIRDFPPCCGNIASMPPQVIINETLGTDPPEVVEKENVESEKLVSVECKMDHQKISVETEARSDACRSVTMSKESFGARFNGTEKSKGKEIAVFPVGKAEMNPDDSVSNDGWKKDVVQALIADGGVNGINQQLDIVPKQHEMMSASLTCDVKSEAPECPNDPDGAYNGTVLDVLPLSAFMPGFDNNDDNLSRNVKNADYSPGESVRSDEMDREIVQCLMAVPHCPWRKRKRILSKSDVGMSGEKEQNPKLSSGFKVKPVAKKSVPQQKISGLKKKKQVITFKGTGATSGPLVLAKDSSHEFDKDSPSSSKKRNFEIMLPPFGANASGNGDARNKVRQTLRLFNAICRKLLHQEEAQSLPEDERKSRLRGKTLNRIDLEAIRIMKKTGREVNTNIILGEVPGVEVGDEFQYRVELALVGVHRPYQSGIDSVKLNDMLVAISIVSSGSYCDDVEKADVLIYSGQGGNVVGKARMRPEDQKLERGNLALRNNIYSETPVRVVRGWKETKTVDPLDPRPKLVMTYVYDGLYTVKNCWTETGPHGKQVFMFELRRNPGQPELAWKQLKKSGKSKIRPGVCVEDISQGQEAFPIYAVNTLNDEKPYPFNYVSKIRYPDWFHPIPPTGCDCTGRCSDSKKCRCAIINGGEIPYNRNGALVETKSLVYECGPLCKCPPSCYNRVTQRGIKFQLEIFKTESRGWGVRALSSIPSGSFICEYAGELLEDKEAEERVGSDEYLFDIGRNYPDSPLRHGEHGSVSIDSKTEGGYTIDAAQYGNVGRFVNHSCLPNLYAQNVLYDHNDARMPHIMLFAVENIPPLQELTYDYNYSMGQIADTDGNIKVKKCFCGAAQCTGRLY